MLLRDPHYAQIIHRQDAPANPDSEMRSTILIYSHKVLYWNTFFIMLYWEKPVSSDIKQ